MNNFIIYPPKNLIAGYIFNYPVRFYGIIMAFAFLLGIISAYFIFKKRYNRDVADLFLDYSPYVILLSVVGARVFYILGSLEFYLQYPREILFINHGGLSIFGALTFGIISIYILSRIKKFNFLAHCDIIAVVCPLCQAIGRFGNYFNQEAYGAPSNGFIRLFVEEKYRIAPFHDVEYFHPAFLYESLLNFAIFILLLFLFLKFKTLKNGTIACLYLIFYACARLIVENIRIDSVLNIATFPIASIIAMFFIVFGFALLGYIYRKN